MRGDKRSFSGPITLSADQRVLQRRTANYKPNIWKHDLLLQSLTSTKYSEEEYAMKAQKQKQELKCMFVEVADPLSMLRLIDTILKLGLSGYFLDEIKHSLNSITILLERRHSTSGIEIEDDLYATALRFRLLRTFGCEASQEMFRGFVNEAWKFKSTTASNVEALTELFEASNMGSEGENLLDEARLFSVESLVRCCSTSAFDAKSDYKEATNVLPLHWTAEWFTIKKHIIAYEKQGNTNPKLLELARLNFNVVQAAHQKDLKEISRWWMDLGISEELRFSRDRVVESFLYAGGVAYETQHRSLRKWLSKVIKLVLIIDDVYDIYGSLEELECFTVAVDRWSPEEVKELPECMKICFWTLYNTTHEISVQIQKEKGWNSVLPHLQKAWGEFCKSLLQEAKWDNEGYTPSLEEYLDNASTSSSGPLLSVHVIFGVGNPTSKNVPEFLQYYRDIIYSTSLIIRLCNDQGTSRAELERGDAPSSILCFMREANVSEDIAREHIKSIILSVWKKMNCWIKSSDEHDEPLIKYLVNEARVAHFMYQNGDGFGVQDRDIVLSSLIEPLPLN